MKNLLLLFAGILILSGYRSDKRGYADVPYIQFTAQTSGTVTCADVKSNMILIHEAVGLSAALTLVLPATPQDGQRVTFVSVNGITVLTMQTPIGGIGNVLSTLLGGSTGTYMWVANKNKWYKVR